MSNPGLPINLAAADMPVIAEAADGVVLPFTVLATDTTGWVFDVPIYRANDSKNGPAGNQIGSGSVANTPGIPNSSIVLTVAAGVTAPYAGQSLWVTMRKTNGVARTLAKGNWVMR